MFVFVFKSVVVPSCRCEMSCSSCACLSPKSVPPSSQTSGNIICSSVCTYSFCVRLLVQVCYLVSLLDVKSLVRPLALVPRPSAYIRSVSVPVSTFPLSVPVSPVCHFSVRPGCPLIPRACASSVSSSSLSQGCRRPHVYLPCDCAHLVCAPAVGIYLLLLFIFIAVGLLLWLGCCLRYLLFVGCTLSHWQL